MEHKELSLEDKRKAAIKGAGYTLEKAAEELKISRTTLYNQISKAELEEWFVQSVKTKIGVDLSTIIPTFYKVLDSTNAVKEPDIDPDEAGQYQKWLVQQVKAKTVTLLDEIATRMIAHTVSDLLINSKDIDLDKNRKTRIRIGLEDAKEYLTARLQG